MKIYELAIAWNWEFDADFIACIERECALRRISTYRIDPQNLQDTLDKLHFNEISFRVFYDRASDADPAFYRLVKFLEEAGSYLINPYALVTHAIDKATMHLEFITHGLEVPDTIIIAPYSKQKEIEIQASDFARLGTPFVIKPANTTGGGTGVVLDAKCLNDVIQARQLHKHDKYLLQKKIQPKDLDGKRGWFRVYCVFGEFIPCWWNDITHEYSELSPEDEAKFGLEKLRSTIKIIQDICRLDFFSSEIALTYDGKFIVVDYVNEVCDMRLKSRYYNGAPDAIVHRIEKLIAERIATYLKEIPPAGMAAVR